MQIKFIFIYNIRISYRTNGTEKEQTLLFIHGNSTSSETFNLMFESILSEKFNLCAIDLPGHGDSAHLTPDKSYSIPTYVEFLTSFVQASGLERIVLVGHSLGGHIAIEAIPSLPQVEGIITFGTPPIGNPPNMMEAFLPNAATHLLFQKNMDDSEIDLLASALTNDQENGHKLISQLIRKSDPRARKDIAKSIELLNYADELQIVKNLKIPLGILHGNQDALINAKYIEQLEIPALLWKKSITYYQEAAHSPQMEYPEMVIEFIDEFLSEKVSPLDLKKVVSDAEHTVRI